MQAPATSSDTTSPQDASPDRSLKDQQTGAVVVPTNPMQDGDQSLKTASSSDQHTVSGDIMIINDGEGISHAIIPQDKRLWDVNLHGSTYVLIRSLANGIDND